MRSKCARPRGRSDAARARRWGRRCPPLRRVQCTEGGTRPRAGDAERQFGALYRAALLTAVLLVRSKCARPGGGRAPPGLGARARGWRRRFPLSPPRGDLPAGGPPETSQCARPGRMRRARTICRWQIVSVECPPPLRRAGRRAPPGLVARARRPFQRRRADRRLRPRLRHGHHLRRHPPDRAEIAAAATGLTGVPVVVGGIIHRGAGGAEGGGGGVAPRGLTCHPARPRTPPAAPRRRAGRRAAPWPARHRRKDRDAPPAVPSPPAGAAPSPSGDRPR